MLNFEESLETIMTERNFSFNGKINYNLSGKFQRFSLLNHYKRSKDLFVVLHDYDKGATFGDWRYPDDWFTYWYNVNGKPTLQELRERKSALEKTKKVQDMDRSKCEWRAREFFNKFYLTVADDLNIYVKNKKITPYYAKQIRSYLIIPISDIDQKLCSVQIIKSNGFKKLWTGTSQKERMIWISNKLKWDYSGVIRICEGYATGCTIHEITKSPVVCAINAHNLTPIAIELRKKFIHATIKICADNDQYGKENTGISHASFAARKTGASLQYPTFDGYSIEHKPTDFNDLFILAGKEVVKRQLILIRK